MGLSTFPDVDKYEKVRSNLRDRRSWLQDKLARTTAARSAVFSYDRSAVRSARPAAPRANGEGRPIAGRRPRACASDALVSLAQRTRSPSATRHRSSSSPTPSGSCAPSCVSCRGHTSSSKSVCCVSTLAGRVGSRAPKPALSFASTAQRLIASSTLSSCRRSCILVERKRWYNRTSRSAPLTPRPPAGLTPCPAPGGPAHATTGCDSADSPSGMLRGRRR